MGPCDWMAPSDRAKVVVSSILGLLAGFVDVICYLRYGAFAVTQTGNLIFIGSSLHTFLLFECTNPHTGGVEEGPGCFHYAAMQIVYSLVVMASSLLGAYAYCAMEHRFPHTTASYSALFLSLLTLLSDVMVSFGPELPAKRSGERWRVLGVDGSSSKWSVCLVAFSMGAVHFLSNTAESSRLKAPAFAATGHMHKCVLTAWRLTAGTPLTQRQKAGAWQSLGVVVNVLLGALLGAVALERNPFDKDGDGDNWLLVPVAVVQYVVLRLHDSWVEPAGGWPQALTQPLHEAKETETAAGALSVPAASVPHASKA